MLTFDGIYPTNLIGINSDNNFLIALILGKSMLTTGSDDDNTHTHTPSWIIIRTSPLQSTVHTMLPVAYKLFRR